MFKKNKTVLAFAVLALMLVAPLTIQAVSTWRCYDLPGNCYGSLFCSGDVMEGAGCIFRCKTGNTVSSWLVCSTYTSPPPTGGIKDPYIQIP